MDSSLEGERARRIETVAAADKSLGNAALAFGKSAPDTVVADYLRALEKGEVDTKAETKLVGKGVSTALLTTEAYSAVPFRVSAPVITESTINKNKGTATVTAQYRVGTERQLVTDTFTLQDKDGSWVLDDSVVVVVPVEVDRSGSVTIGGTDVTKDLTDKNGKMSGRVALLPGQYAAGFSEPTKFWGADSSSVVVGTEAEPKRFSMTTTVSQAVQDEVNAAAQAHLNVWFDECVGSRLTGAACSPTVQEEGGYISDKIVHRIFVDSYPMVTVAWIPDTNTFTYVGFGVIATEGSGPGGLVKRPVSLGFTGTLTWHGPGNVEIPLGFL